MLGYVKWKGKNFGDELNDELFPKRFGVSAWKDLDDPLPAGTFLLGIGTILNAYLRPSKDTHFIVFGSGTGYKTKRPKLSARILFVRGPLTCDFLGLKRALAISDAAYALTEQFRAAAAPAPEFDLGLIPHHWSLENFPEAWDNPHGLHVISPHLPFAEFVREVSRCRKVVTECLHGAIAADMLDVPWLALQTSPAFHSFKWLDWTASIGLPLALHYARPRELSPERLRHGRFQLSKAARRGEIVRAIGEKAEELDGLLAKLRTTEL